MRIDMILEPYRANVRYQELIRAAIVLAEDVLGEGGVFFRGSAAGASDDDFFWCQYCKAKSHITYENGRVSDVEEMPHLDTCPVRLYEEAKKNTRIRNL